MSLNSDQCYSRNRNVCKSISNTCVRLSGLTVLCFQKSVLGSGSDWV